MKLNVIGSNQTELHSDKDTIVFFSYNTPVAAYIPSTGYVRTEEKHSVTTTRHVNKWLMNKSYELVAQSAIEALL